MVFFKRKPVQYAPPPYIDNDEQEVWEIKQTKEIFTDYEQYLTRMDFYKQRKFICQITGHSQLTFLEALKSEEAGAQEVEAAFPEALKGPILRRVQFQTISRIDTLVDLIYDEFRADYYPNEAVTVHVFTGERLAGIVRDKTRFGSKQMPDGTVTPSFSRYFVSLDNRPLEEAVVDDSHICRDRKIFTKQVLRSFIKKTVTREAWTGAPWLVKPDIAAEHHIDTRVPPHLRQESKAAERKQSQAQKRAASHSEFDGMIGSFPRNAPAAQLPELKPAPKSHKSKAQQSQVAKSKQQPFLNSAPNHPHPNPFPPPPPPPQYVPQPPYQSHTFQAGPPQVGPHYNNFHNPAFAFAPMQQLPPQPPPPPPIKYPIEDLQVAPRHDSPTRPPIKFFSQDTPRDVGTPKIDGNGILMSSMGHLLESWDTLNVYCEIFKLDSFTFDDFAEAMQFSSDEIECELFVEVHCAVLKLLVNGVSGKADDGKINVQLPEMDEEEDEEESDAEETPKNSPTPEPEPKPKGRATRSSLAKAEAEAAKAEQEESREESETPKDVHRAAEMQLEGGWIDRLRKRDFKNGGWQFIMIGLLYQLSKGTRFSVEDLLVALAPLDMPPTLDTASQQYNKLDVNLRIKALQIICMLTAETKAIRAYMEECSEQMTGFRKEKIQYQREKKQLIVDLAALNEERKILLPANTPPSPLLENKTLNGDIKMPDVEEEDPNSTLEDEIMDTDEDPHQGRSLRRGLDRAADRKRKREAEQEKKEKAEAEAKMPKQSKQFTKLMKDIQKKQDAIRDCEEEIAIIDNDLREADCPRTRVLGKDRFWNRYYWFERNGMPYGGLPNSSTAEAGYANGCIWVQGPDDLEREGYIEMKPEWQNEYLARFNMTVPERKVLEEGATSVFNARQWGYIDTPASLDALISWLDTRGINEIKLSKELKSYRDKIALNMEHRLAYLNPPPPEEKVEEGKRMSTRKKERDVEELDQRCLRWRNSMAVLELGHLHCEDPPKSEKRKVGKKEKEKVKEEEVVVVEREERKTRGKKDKVVEKERREEKLGRQGTRYNF